MELTIYKINQYEAYRADEKGIHYTINPPGENTPYYKSESKAIEIELPNGFSVIKICDGLQLHLIHGDDEVLIGEDKKGLYLEICDLEQRKIYPKVIRTY